jgi:hypothetical protein
MFSDLNEVFFYDFPHLLQEWLLILKYKKPTNKIRHMEWNFVEIAQLQQVNNKFTHAVDFWLDIIFPGFITEFAINTMKSYIVVEKYFLKGPIGRYIISMYTSIKILLYDNGVITMESDN